MNIERRKQKCPKMSHKKRLVPWHRGATICPDCGGSLVTSPLLSVVPIVFGLITELRNAGHSVPLGGVAHDMDRRCKVQDIKIEMRAGVYATCQDGTT